MEASKLRRTIERSIQQPAELGTIVILRASAEGRLTGAELIRGLQSLNDLAAGKLRPVGV